MRAGVDEVEQPLAVRSEFEVVVLLLDQDDLPPFGAELAIGPAFFFGEELLLADAVVTALCGFVELAFVPQALEHALHAAFMEILDSCGPGVVAEIEFFPEREKERGDLGNELRRLDSTFLSGLLHFLAMLIHTGEEENLAPVEPLVAGDGVGEDFFVGVADMRRAVCVVDGCGDKKSIRHGRSGFDFDFSAPGQDAGLSTCGFGLLDLVVSDMEEREAGPRQHVLRAKFHGPQAGLNRLGIVSVFHKRHSQRMPAIEKIRIQLHAAAVFFNGSLEIANRYVAGGIVEYLLNFRQHQPWRPAGIVIWAASRPTRSHSMKRKSRLLRSRLSRISASRVLKVF